jgi:GNAT superfamily N-acetyltransferase
MYVLDGAVAMKGFIFFLSIFLLSVYHLDAFVLPKNHRREASIATRAPTCSNRVFFRPDRPFLYNSQLDASNDNVEGSKSERTNTESNFTHADIVWKIRPPPNTRRYKKIFTRLAANLIRLDCKIKRVDPPVLLCPKGGQAVLEAYTRVKKENSKRTKLVKIGRFGITTENGPPVLSIQETVADLYGLDPNVFVRTAAIIYMFVEPEHRRRDLGTLALQVIPLMHSIQGCDFTVLVADDNGSGKLVEWYQQHGYMLAPKLQDVFGSPNQKFGITMIAPTQSVLPKDCFIQWW